MGVQEMNNGTLDFNELADHEKFEDLVVAYFQDIENEPKSQIVNVSVKPSGTGCDGGRDILVTFKISDSLTQFDRKWVVQCKFHKSRISTNKIADINIPTLLHSYNASVYLLVCREKPTSKLTDLFERLENNCKFGNKYLVWSGEQFKRLIKIKTKKELLQQFFPQYYNDCIKNKVFEQ